MLRRSIRMPTLAMPFSQPPSHPHPTMINVFLALVPLLFATGALVWTMTSGARAQVRSDEWAAQWMRDNA